MSNYTVQTNFGAKDDLPSGNAAKVIRGADFTVEFDNIATAIGTKLNSSSGSATNLTTTGTLTNSGAMTTTGTATFNGNMTTAGIATFNGNVVVDTDTFVVDVTADKVGINNDSPATALDVTGVITTDGLTTSAAINLPDDTKINFGASDKLKIYYDTDVGEVFQKSRIQTSTDISNALYLQSTVIALTNVDATESYLTALNGSSVSLFYDNVLTLSTKYYGVDIKGTAKVETNNTESANLKLKNTEGEFDIRCDGGALDIYDVTDSASRLSFDTSGIATFSNTLRSDVFTGKTATNSLIVLGSDAVTFNETNGTTILAPENLNLLAGVDDKIQFGEAGNYSTKMAVLDTSNGNFGINTDTPTEKLDVNSDSIRLRTAKTPASATATGTQGQIAWDANYMYVCTATNTWKRVALATWS